MKRIRLPSSPTGGQANLHETDAPRHITVGVRLSEGEAIWLADLAKGYGDTLSGAFRRLLWERKSNGSNYVDVP